MQKKQNTIVLQKRDFGDGGGVATLFWRIAKYCNTHDIDCYIFVGKIKEKDAKFYEETNVKCINVNVTEGIRYIKNIRKFIDGLHGKITVISTEFKDYVRIHDAYADKEDIRNILYAVHENTFNKINAGYHRKFQDKFIYKHLFIRCLNSGDLFFCDRFYVDYPMEYYGIEWPKKDSLVLPLPVEIDNKYIINWVDKIDNISRKRTLLSIARAEFPFKSYLLGLIDVYEELYKIYDGLKLQIISYGAQYDELKKYVDDINERSGCCIELINGVEYDILPKYYKNAFLNIGMGTTILEAANFELPTIVVKSFSREALSFGDFTSNPLYVTAPNGTVNVSVYIREILDMGTDEYKLLCKKTKETLVEYYSMENFIGRITSDKKNDKKIFGNIDKLYWDMKDIAKKIHLMFK